MTMDWPYFDLVPTDETETTFNLVDEQGQPLTVNGEAVLFFSHEDAEDFLKRHNIRGSIR